MLLLSLLYLLEYFTIISPCFNAKAFLSLCFILSPIMQLAGAVILGVGVWVKVDSGSLLGILDTLEDAPSGLSQLVNVSYLLMAVGAVLLVIGFLGCCGAVRESRCMLLTVSNV